jgi:hypothetical protein
MNCIHGIDMSTTCYSCRFDHAVKDGEAAAIAEQARPMATDKVRSDDIEFGDPIVQIALHQSSVKRVEDSIAALGSAVFELTQVARSLLLLGEDMQKQRHFADSGVVSRDPPVPSPELNSKGCPEKHLRDYTTDELKVEILTRERGGWPQGAPLPEIVFGNVRDAEVDLINNHIGGVQLTDWGRLQLVRGLNKLLRGRGVL